jgi:hypothetical protein
MTQRRCEKSLSSTLAGTIFRASSLPNPTLQGEFMDSLTKFLFFCALLVAVSAMIGFWPGRYQYYNAQAGTLVRVNRYTAATEQYIYNVGWIVPKPAPASGQVDLPTRPPSENPEAVSSPGQRDASSKPIPSPTKSKLREVR